MFATLLLAATIQQSAPASCCAPSMNQFANDPAFLAAHMLPKQGTKPTQGTAVDYKDANGKPTTGFYIGPKPGNKVGVILIHEFWGLNDNIRNEAAKLHDEMGYGVLAVDLYEGKVTADRNEAGQLMQGVNQDRAAAIVKGAVDSLRNGKFGFKASKVGSVGWCFGGGWSLRTAIEGGKKLNACVAYYGMPDSRPEAVAKIFAPVLFIHAMKDTFITAPIVDKFAEAMHAQKKTLKVLHYDAAHGFANPSNPIYDGDSATKAHAETIAWFKKYL